MKVERLRVADFRCFQSVEFAPGPAVSWLVGANGAGKTSLLEAAHLLSHGHSFRSANRAAPCRENGGAYSVYAELTDHRAARHRVGLTRDREQWSARVDGESLATLAPLFEACPVVYFGPESAALMVGPTDARRSFLDWSVFHVEHASLDVWKRWRRVLRQRNTLLRQAAPDAAFEPWEHDLAELGEHIHRSREACLRTLNPYFSDTARWLAPELGAPKVVYRAGWSVEAGLAAQLAEQRASDRERGFTQRGPQRGDWMLVFETAPHREQFSRGQAKVVALVCALAQTRWLGERVGGYPLLCLDDVTAELDARHCEKVLGWLAERPLQAWLTSTVQPPPAYLSAGVPVFHVEHSGIVSA